MKLKNYGALFLACVCALSIGSCSQGQDGARNSETTARTAGTTAPVTSLNEEQAAAVAEIEVKDAEKLENGVVKWLSFWDINPTEGKPQGAFLELFSQNYGGSIEYIPTTWNDRFDALGKLVAAGDSPDMFPAADGDVFPRCAIGGMFEAIDDYVDLTDPMWDDMKTMNDNYMLGDKHYIANVEVDADCVMIYNKQTMIENGFTDPLELLNEGNWNWDTMYDMLIQFCDRNDDKFGIDGWWFENAISLTTGVPYVGIKGGKLVHNLNDPMVVKVQDYMMRLQRADIPYPKAEHDWTIAPQNIAAGKTLFYPCGTWCLYEPDLSNFGEYEDIEFVPMPRCPDADEYYIPARADAYALVKGGQNLVGAGKFIECKKISATDERTKEISKQQFFDDYHWTEEMWDMYQTVIEYTKQHPAIEMCNSLNGNITDLLSNNIKNSFNAGTPWTETKDSIIFAVESELDAVNAKLGN
ncbi:MAG: extracellular solute-binding protein [Ruminiclostridium sp.]|nr:extracellular solute-binding protein [Ruminiclostridium sp.]